MAAHLSTACAIDELACRHAQLAAAAPGWPCVTPDAIRSKLTLRQAILAERNPTAVARRPGLTWIHQMQTETIFVDISGTRVGVVIRDALWTTSSSEGTGLDWERINRQLGVWGVPT